MDALHLHVKQAGWIHQHARVAVDVGRQLALHGELGVFPMRQEASVVLAILKLAQDLHIGDPVGAHMLIKQGRESGIGECNPAPRGHAIGHVGEFFGPELSEFRHQLLTHQVGVERCHTIHVMGANGGEVCHPDRLTPLLINDREFALNRLVTGVTQAHLLQEAAVDFVNQLKVPRQQASKQVEIPFFEGLGKQGVVGVSHGTAGDVPRLVPFHVTIIDQQTHQFCHRDGGVGVVELNGPVLREVVNGQPTVIEAAQHVLKGAAHKEVLLFQA